MGRGTIQQRVSRIKGRLRLWVYDLRQDIRAVWGNFRASIDTPRGQAVSDAVSLISVAIIAFVLGQMSVESGARHEVVHDTAARMERMVPQMGKVLSPQQTGSIVASRNGKRWHYTWCPGAETISDKNKRYFKTEAEAEKAGYTKASNCK